MQIEESQPEGKRIMPEMRFTYPEGEIALAVFAGWGGGGGGAG